MAEIASMPAHDRNTSDEDDNASAVVHTAPIDASKFRDRGSADNGYSEPGPGSAPWGPAAPREGRPPF